MAESHRLCVCVKNDGYAASLELRKIYETIDDEDAAAVGQIRVVDESGEDYLYPEEFFVRVELPAALKQKLMESV